MHSKNFHWGTIEVQKKKTPIVEHIFKVLFQVSRLKYHKIKLKLKYPGP